MSILSDRRSLREIGGFGNYVRQVGWSLWWHTQHSAEPKSRRKGSLPATAAYVAPVPSTGSSRVAGQPEL